MFGRVFTELEAAERGRPLSEVGVLTKDRAGPDPDEWDGYPAERDRLLRHLRDRAIANVVFVSATSTHPGLSNSAATRTRLQRRRSRVEFVTPSITSKNFDDLLKVPARTRSRTIEQRILDDNRHIRWVELGGHGYLLLDITAGRIQASWHFVQPHLQPDARGFIAATWQLKSGDSSPAEPSPRARCRLCAGRRLESTRGLRPHQHEAQSGGWYPAGCCVQPRSCPYRTFLLAAPQIMPYNLVSVPLVSCRDSRV